LWYELLCNIIWNRDLYLVIPLDLKMKYQADVPNSIPPNTARLLRKSVVNALGASNNNNNRPAAIMPTLL
jgi:hypothetical protein